MKAAHAAWKMLTERRANVLAPVEAAITDQKKEIARYEVEREAERKAALVAQEALLSSTASESEQLEAALSAPAAEPVVKQQGVVSLDVWTWRVVDQSLIPARYMVPARPDTEKITRVVRALKAQTDIPGIEVYQERQIRALAR